MPEPSVAPDMDKIRAGGRRMKIRRALGATLATVVVAAAGTTIPQFLSVEDTPGRIGPGTAGHSGQLPMYDFEPVGRPETIAKGSHEGTDWKLIGYDTTSGRYCSEFEIVGGAGFAACELYVPEFEQIQALRGYDASHPRISAVLGAVSKEVATVEIHLDDGTVIEADIYRGPELANFYLAFPEPGVSGTVVAKDGSGAVLETDIVEVCQPNDGSRSSSCGHRAPDGHGE